MSDNVVVAVRVRPLITRETEKNSDKLWEVENGNFIYQVSSPSEKFCFDRVFDTEETNYNVYKDLCLPIVESVMQGFNGTIFAYGQTSSGKTFTMMGEYNGIYKGVIHYSISDIFNIIQRMPDREFLLRVSFLEIYNERVYDLLSDKNEDLKLLEDGYGNIKVNGLQEQIVQTAEQIWEWMLKGQKKRRTGETQMNRVSSRSHSIFRMIIESRLKDEDVVNVSQLNLVDLAGSENLKQTNAKKERFKEGVHINLSLSTLSQVISQLSERDDQFINYRSSKLTRLLQNSLGGNALTAIICAVTPASLKETLSTLYFAQRAKKIQNKPKINEIMTDQALLKQYANKIKKLSQELQVTKEQGKELEEKTKQNEILKRQIEALKANFVSQAVKSSRRETWGGRHDARRFQLENLRKPVQPISDLPVLEEEPEGDLEATDYYANRIYRQSCSSYPRASLSKSISNAETQTEPENEEHKCGVECVLSTNVSESDSLVATLQMELRELQAYTTLERQLLRAENELQSEIEIQKQENSTLRKRLDSLLSELSAPSDSPFSDSPYQKNFFESSNESCQTDSLSKVLTPKECQTSPLKSDGSLKLLQEQNVELELCNQNLRHKLTDLEASHCAEIKILETKFNSLSESNSKLQLMSEELEAKYEKELAEIKHQLKETENELCNLKHWQEKASELEDCNKDLSQKLIDSVTSHCAQIKELEAKFDTAQSEVNTKSLMIKELEAKYQKELSALKLQVEEAKSQEFNDWQEKASELEDCNKDLSQKLIDSVTSHCAQIEELEAKFDTAQSELNTKSLMIKELEAKYEKELSALKLQVEEAKSQEFNDLKQLQENYSELEECNRKLKQELCDLVSSHQEVKVAEEKGETSESELLLKINNLEADLKELTEFKNQLQEKYSELELCNSNLRQQITDLEASHFSEIKELEENFEKERSEWNSKTVALLKDLEAKYDQELTDQENKLTEDLQTVFNKKMQLYIKEVCDLKEEIENVNLQNVELSNDKQQYLERIKELNQVYSESLDKRDDQIIQIRKESSEAVFATKAKYENMITQYKDKVKKCKVVYTELQTQAQHYMEENERLKNEVGSDSSQHLEEKVKDLLNERNHLQKKYTAAKQEISEFKVTLKKYCKELEDQKRLLRDAGIKELQECNKMLRFDLDQKMAKIISLETNNASLIQEIKLRDKVSSKSGNCKCKMSNKGPEFPVNQENFKENFQNEKFQEKNGAEVQENYRPVPIDDVQKENIPDSKETEKGDQGDLYLIGGGSGPANMVKCYWLEGMIYQKDKEIKKLKQKCAELNSELTAIKRRPDIPNDTKPEVSKPDVGKTPVSVLKEKNENAQENTPSQYQRVGPKVLERQNLRHQKRDSKPYAHPVKSATMKKTDEFLGQLKGEKKEDGQRPQTEGCNDVLHMISGEPECTQQ